MKATEKRAEDQACESAKSFACKKTEGNVVLPNGLELNMTRKEYLGMELLQGYVMEIMLVVDRFCREHNITYYLGEGTLLGALRHKGFIPWDDDIDILMPREDYERFLELARTGLPEGYQLDSVATNPNHWTIMAQVQMTRKVICDKPRLKGIALNNGPSLDIFPVDYVPVEHSRALRRRAKKIQILRRTLWIKSGLHPRSWYKTLWKRLKYYYPLKLYGMFRKMKGLHNHTERLMTATNQPDMPYMSVFSSLYAVDRETFPREYFGEPRYVEFEGHMLPIPQKSEKMLERIYGEYMLLPAVQQRKSKHFFQITEAMFAQLENDPVFRNVKYTLEDLSEAEPQNAEAGSKEAPKSLRNKVGRLLIKVTHSGFANKVKQKIRSAAVRMYRILLGEDGERLHKYRSLPIEEKTVLYDAFSGLGVLDSPRALFKAMLKREEFADFTHIWAVNNKSLSWGNMKEFSDLPNVKFVLRNSNTYLRYLSVSKYIIANSSVPQYFARRPEQVYLNTWHGVPTKVMGYERPGQRVNATENIEHNYLNATHLIAANHFTGERMFKQAYMLDGIYEGILIDEPLPRTDAIYNTDRDYVMGKLADAGIVTDKKIIVYAPTWKGALYNNLVYDLTELKDAVKTIRSRINNDEYDVFLRVHYFLYRSILMDEEMKKLCIPFTVDTNELLSVVDILISDYSSIFFDFLGTRRPILFYVPDLKEYTENRGLYIPMDQLPGPVKETLEDIADCINDIDRIREAYREKYDAMHTWCCAYEDGHAADRVLDAVFLNRDCKKLPCATDKKKVLLFADWTKPFVHQVALTKMLERIDYTRYDITLLTGKPKDPQQAEYLEKLDPRVRILVNNKKINIALEQQKRTYKGLQNGTLSLEKAAQLFYAGNEWQRLVGDSVFDELIMVTPSDAPFNWLLASYVAPVMQKALVTNEEKGKYVYPNPALTAHFSEIYEDLAFMKRYLREEQ